MINIDYSSNLNSDPFARYQRHKAQIKQEGSGNGKLTILLNLSHLAKDLEREEKTIGSYLAKSLGTRFKFNTKDKKFVLNGHFTCEQIDSLIQKFIEADVLCRTCANPETHPTTKICKACGTKN